MGKITGAFQSLVRGVSEQVPHDRLPGQFWMQDNMISDPVRGLARRHGSRMLHELAAPTVAYSTASRDDASMFKEHSFNIFATEYSLAYREQAKVVGSTLPGVVLVDRSAGRIRALSTNPADTLTTSVLDTGVSSVVSVGRYVLMSSRSQPTTFTQVDATTATATSHALWIKGGNYSRTFKVTIFNSAGALLDTVSYTTMTSFYQGDLDTSDILTSDPDYQKKVNDRVNDYNTAVNQHIAAAAASIQPENIAEQLRILIAAEGYTVTRFGSHLYLSFTGSVEIDDGGDGAFAKSVSRTVRNVADLTEQHLVGKVVAVAPVSGAGNTAGARFYVKAIAKTPGATGFQEVRWEETAGVLTTPTFVFLLGTVVSDVFYVASTPALLSALTGLSDVPVFLPSTSGDLVSQPNWQFLGGTIEHMRLFQDRLMLVSGATVFMSRAGDYFNFFRGSALTLADDDPIEIFAEGSEGDVVRAGVTIDRNLLLFGRKQQYAVPGRELVSPATAFITVQSTHEHAADASPVANGNLVFFMQPRDSRLTLQQLQTGAYADSFDAYDMSPQLDGYLGGTAQQIVACNSPAMIFVRTRELRNGVYVYSYHDNTQAERLQDSWSRWVWDEAAGTLISICTTGSAMLALQLRDGSGGVYFVLDRFSREAALSDYPYLDSWRPYLDTVPLGSSLRASWLYADRCGVAFTKAAGQYRLLGRALEEAAALFETVPDQEANAIVGLYFDSVIEPTAPYRRDFKDNAILDCRMTLTKLNVTLADSSAMRAYLRQETEEYDPSQLIVNWISRPAGTWLVNTQSISKIISVTIPVMREIREHRLRISSRNWLPMTLSAIEYSAQFFSLRR